MGLFDYMLSLDDFLPVTLESKPLFDAHFQKYPPVHSDYVFTTMAAWHEYAHYEYAFVDDSLVLKTTVDDMVQFRPPIGSMDKSLFSRVLELAASQEGAVPLSMVTDDVKAWIEAQFDQFSFVPILNYADYVYRSSDLSSLRGSEYRKIRNRLNKFVKNVSFETEQITEDIISEVRQFLKRWCIWRDCEDDPILKYEKKAVIFSANHFCELELSGMAIRIDGRIEAVSVYEPMNHSMIVVHFEKGSPDFDGIYKCINQELAKTVEDRFPFINRESDMGNPGLRKAKQSYRPDHMLSVYEIKRK